MFLNKNVRNISYKIIINFIFFEILIILYQSDDFYEILNKKNLKTIFNEKSKIYS